MNAVSTDKSSLIYAEIHIEEKPVRMQINSGAAVNVLLRRFAGNCKILPTPTVLLMYNKTKVKPLGEAQIVVRNPSSGKRYQVKFIIVPDNHGLVPLLGSKASQQMNFITVHTENFKRVAAVTPESALDSYPDAFKDELGTLSGPVHFEVDPSITPVIAPDRRVPTALREPLKKELQRLVDLGVIAAIDQPTDWVSNIVVAVKKSGDLRVCIDPQGLNKALKRERYQLPILEDLLPELSKARVFTTIDLKAGYWHVTLDEPSSLMTTFSTPFGRYRWLRLPFG